MTLKDYFSVNGSSKCNDGDVVLQEGEFKINGTIDGYTSVTVVIFGYTYVVHNHGTILYTMDDKGLPKTPSVFSLYDQPTNLINNDK